MLPRVADRRSTDARAPWVAPAPARSPVAGPWRRGRARGPVSSSRSIRIYAGSTILPGAGLYLTNVSFIKRVIKTKMKLKDRSLVPPRNFFTPGARPATAAAVASRSQASSAVLPIPLAARAARAPHASIHRGSPAQTTARTLVVVARPRRVRATRRSGPNRFPTTWC